MHNKLDKDNKTSFKAHAFHASKQVAVPHKFLTHFATQHTKNYFFFTGDLLLTVSNRDVTTSIQLNKR